MVRHLLESIALVADNAIRFLERSAGETRWLSRDLLVFQVKGVRMALGLDRLAQLVHSRNVGIVVNDIPTIPTASSHGPMGLNQEPPA